VTGVTRALLLALAAATAGACHRTQAARLPEPPAALDIPSPPSRVIIPVTLAAYEPPPAPEPPPPAPSPARPATNNRPADKPAPTPTPPAAEIPAPVLQATPNPNASEQKVLALLQTADRDLNRVPYNQLSPVGKDHYQRARSFVQLAYDSLKMKNYNYAEYLADKAAVVAGMLVKR
jgi:hypothetical protein